MKSMTMFAAGLTIGATGLFGWVAPQTPTELKPGDLKGVLSGLGYTPKDLSNEKFEVTITKDQLDVPVGVEISKSGRKIWLTAYLGDANDKLRSDAARLYKMLQKNFDIQPSLFYVTTKDRLMVGLPVDNRGVTPVVLRTEIDKLVGDVVSTRPLWDVE